MVNQTAKQQRRQAKQQRQQVKLELQAMTNAVLWKIIDNNGGKMNISKADMDAVPPEATLKTLFDPDTNTFLLTAVKPGPKVIVPEKKLIIVRNG